jgi:hypothetical protein
VVDEQHLHHAGAGLRGALFVDDHPVGGLHVARDLRLRVLLDLDHADAAVARDREARVVAVVDLIRPPWAT